MTRLIPAIFLASALSATSAVAEIYGFSNITGNNALDAAAGESGLTMEVTAYGVDAEGHNQVLFMFRNNGPAAMSITDIYFDDGTLLAISSLQESSGVDFEKVAAPKNLPGASLYNFRPERNGFYNSFFSLDSESPIQPMGINPGEWLGIVYSLQGDQTFASVIAALALSQTDIHSDIPGGLRVGVHVQGFAGGGSEAFINGPSHGSPSSVPDAGTTAVLLGLGFLSLGVTRRCIA